jgi:hypothetical protein
LVKKVLPAGEIVKEARRDAIERIKKLHSAL